MKYKQIAMHKEHKAKIVAVVVAYRFSHIFQRKGMSST